MNGPQTDNEVLHPEQDSEDEAAPAIQPAADGAGPLLQRDYSGIIEGCTATPEELILRVRRDFAVYSPDLLARFTRADGASDPLELEDQLQIHIVGAGDCEVRVAHLDEQSFTLRTLEGHPEAGRITFGAFRNPEGDLVFRIRSRARAGSVIKLVGYTLFGKKVQTRVWVTFIERVAEACGCKLRDEVRVETKEVADSAADLGEADTPTFVAAYEG